MSTPFSKKFLNFFNFFRDNFKYGGDGLASIFIRTFILYIFLAICMKIMGKRQIGELEINELVTTFVISEVAALPIADPDIPLLNAIIPILLIVCLEIIISSVKNKSEKLKKYIEGEPTFLIYRGKMLQDALADNRISVNELLTEARVQGIADIGDAEYAVLEQNGKISIFEKNSAKRFSQAVIIDKEINHNSLKMLGYDETWLNSKLECKKITKDDVFLMTATPSGDINIILKEAKR